jgi:hypothetical protein
MGLGEVVRDDVDWIRPAQDRDKWQVPANMEKPLTSQATPLRGGSRLHTSCICIVI